MCALAGGVATLVGCARIRPGVGMKRWSRRALWRVAVATGVLLALPAVGFAMPAGPAAGRPDAHPRTAGGGITYAANTVVIPRSVVSAQLIAIAPGGVYKFKAAAGPLAQLKPGRVMVLEGSAAGVVTSVQTANHQLIVHTRDATVGQVIKSGTVKFDFAPDFHKAFAAPINVAEDGAATASAHPASGRPAIPTSRLPRRRRPEASRSRVAATPGATRSAAPSPVRGRSTSADRSASATTATNAATDRRGPPRSRSASAARST